MAYGDTSTGVANDVAARRAGRRAHGALMLVDGVSSIGGMPFAFDDVGRRRRRHGVAEMSDVEPRPRVGRDERTRMAGQRYGAPAAQLLELCATSSDRHRQAPAGDARHDPGAARAAGRRGAADDARGRFGERVCPPRGDGATRARRCGASLDSSCSARRSRATRRRSRRSRCRPASRRRRFATSLKERGILTAAALGPYERQRRFASATWVTSGCADVERTLAAVGERSANRRCAER